MNIEFQHFFVIQNHLFFNNLPKVIENLFDDAD